MRRQRALDVALAGLGTLLGLFFVTQSLNDGVQLETELVSGVLAFAGLVLFRRTHPVALTLVLLPLGILFAMPMGAIPIALFAVGLHRRAHLTIGLLTLHAASVVIIYRLAIADTRTYLEAVTFLVLLHVILVVVAMLLRSQRSLVRSLAARARQAEDGQRMRIEQARLAERQRIAREMHDVLAHRISLLAVHAGAMEVRRDAPADERAAAGVIRQSAYEALEDLREVIGTLRDQPEEDRPQPTLDDLPALVEQSRGAGATVELEFDRGPEVPAPIGRHAYRIVQEALTNARKHAPGAPVRVVVRDCAEQELVVEVGNALGPGGGLPGAGTGLIGLRERVALVGGRLEHGPTASGRWQLKAWLPW